MGKDDKKDPSAKPDSSPQQSKHYSEDLDAKIEAAQAISDKNAESAKKPEIIQGSTVKTETPKAATIASKIKLPKVTLPELKFPTNLFPKQLGNFKLPTDLNLSKINKESVKGALKVSVNWIIANCNPTAIKKIMADNQGAASSGRAMKYPYTFSAKVAQFPLKYYINNQWIWKYYFVSFAVCLPVFYSISNLANSPGNKAKWAEIRRKEAAEHHH